MENHLDKKLDNEMEAGLYSGVLAQICLPFKASMWECFFGLFFLWSRTYSMLPKTELHRRFRVMA